MTVDHRPGPGHVAPAAVRRAVAYIDAHAAEPISAEDITTAALNHMWSLRTDEIVQTV